VHFSLPLIKPQARTGWTVPVNLPVHVLPPPPEDEARAFELARTK